MTALGFSTKYDDMLPNFAFNLNLRLYIWAFATLPDAALLHLISRIEGKRLFNYPKDPAKHVYMVRPRDNPKPYTINPNL